MEFDTDYWSLTEFKCSLCGKVVPIKEMVVFHDYVPGMTPKDVVYPEKYYIELCASCAKRAKEEPEVLTPLMIPEE